MVLALGGAGLYFGSSSHSPSLPPFPPPAGRTSPLTSLQKGRSPTGASSESPVGVASSGMPWEAGVVDGKYRYHPGGDPTQSPKDAPSAVNVVVVPNVNLPKRLHDQYNKWGKDGY